MGLRLRKFVRRVFGGPRESQVPVIAGIVDYNGFLIRPLPLPESQSG